MKAVENKVDEVAVVFDREEERKELAPITVISTISLEVNTLKNLLRCHFDHRNTTLRDLSNTLYLIKVCHLTVSFPKRFDFSFDRRTTRETQLADG